MTMTDLQLMGLIATGGVCLILIVAALYQSYMKKLRIKRKTLEYKVKRFMKGQNVSPFLFFKREHYHQDRMKQLFLRCGNEPIRRILDEDKLFDLLDIYLDRNEEHLYIINSRAKFILDPDKVIPIPPEYLDISIMDDPLNPLQ